MKGLIITAFLLSWWGLTWFIDAIATTLFHVDIWYFGFSAGFIFMLAATAAWAIDTQRYRDDAYKKGFHDAMNSSGGDRHGKTI